MTREDLINYKDNKEWVDEQLEDYNVRIERVMNLTQTITGLPKAQGKPNYELEKIIDDFKEIFEIIHKEQEKLNEVLKQVNELKPLYKKILTKRYIEGKKLEQVATEINYGYYTTCRFNGYALNEFDKLDKS
jgi:DNA-directed RNA polymerase specialized sigma24 family protein